MGTYVEDLMDRARTEMPDCPDDLLRLYVLLALTQGDLTSMRNVHDAWALWRMTTKPEHPAIIPFDALDPSVQLLDLPYVQAIRRIA